MWLLVRLRRGLGHVGTADDTEAAGNGGVKRSEPPVPVKSHAVMVPYPSGAVEQPAEVQKASFRACIVTGREFVGGFSDIPNHSGHSIFFF
jgi:hypothetical protein